MYNVHGQAPDSEEGYILAIFMVGPKNRPHKGGTQKLTNFRGGIQLFSDLRGDILGSLAKIFRRGDYFVPETPF